MHILAYEATRFPHPGGVRLPEAACKDDREKAIVLTLAGTGMRVNELCNRGIEDLDLSMAIST